MLNNGYYIHLGTKFRCRVYEKTFESKFFMSIFSMSFWGMLCLIDFIRGGSVALIP